MEETANDFVKNKFSIVIPFIQILLNLQALENLALKKINDLLNLQNPTVAPYANLGEVKLRITARAKNEVEADDLIKPVKEKLKKDFSKFIFGEDNDTLPSVLIKELAHRNKLLFLQNPAPEAFYLHH